MRKRDNFEDDGRTIADMSGIGPAPTLRPHRRKADAPPPEPANDRPWEQAPDWTPKEKFWAVMGVLKATKFFSLGPTQNPLVVTPYGFDPHHRHSLYLSLLAA